MLVDQGKASTAHNMEISGRQEIQNHVLIDLFVIHSSPLLSLVSAGAKHVHAEGSPGTEGKSDSLEEPKISKLMVRIQ
ncbi:MAG TPA: hypothetical protein VD884_21255 [Ohtaekwangia sp.]|nr:hypothetical protein [Ohtaekwangia sp.]